MRLPAACLLLCLGAGCEVVEEDEDEEIAEEVDLDEDNDVGYGLRRYECLITEHDGWHSYYSYESSHVNAIERCNGRVNEAAAELCDVRWNQEYFGITMHVYLEGRYRILSDTSDWKCVDGEESYF